MKIEGNTFVITGGLGGIGSEVASGIVENGGKVALFDVLDEKIGNEKALSYGQGKAIYQKVDVSNSNDVKVAVENVVEKLGNLKGAVHLAAISIKRDYTNDLADSIEDFQKMWKINTLGTFIVDAQVADAINKPLNHPNGSNEKADFWTTDEERGVIINFGSAAAHGLYSRTLCYGPLKLAVNGISRTLSDFLGPSGIRVNTISPSIVMTAMNAKLGDYFQDDLTSHAAFPRVPVPASEIFKAVKFLIESTWVNGEDIRVDGGWRLVVDRPKGGVDARSLAPGLE
ncbi:3-oxoacyl-[acyl-carrier-protein] reductase [Wickerhamomyces ciferrii]|uniref:3-oxoacyl-[acyl-carrier-protein] reductase n=1 Tax=Wickerhamomyces ciferrii (strain ATCC 14091 / BCRC 22168 / CBS 111 / JCM 3599 / NBRC 0793 / NRRL Y-1031 F-60-10) TaxID=1206466 RepID=K0KL03_WICCF|nr:3-oxoacyl-[acyl-carrier-protein] reductase [Wickerhamomyces ciferrii]CCH42837.1 3-oxoacyl-[acyl-carrier-protein] reductase [Wickerhamomyces ciferrii]